MDADGQKDANIDLGAVTKTVAHVINITIITDCALQRILSTRARNTRSKDSITRPRSRQMRKRRSVGEGEKEVVCGWDWELVSVRKTFIRLLALRRGCMGMVVERARMVVMVMAMVVVIG